MEEEEMEEGVVEAKKDAGMEVRGDGVAEVCGEPSSSSQQDLAALLECRPTATQVRDKAVAWCRQMKAALAGLEALKFEFKSRKAKWGTQWRPSFVKTKPFFAELVAKMAEKEAEVEALKKTGGPLAEVLEHRARFKAGERGPMLSLEEEVDVIVNEGLAVAATKSEAALPKAVVILEKMKERPKDVSGLKEVAGQKEKAGRRRERGGKKEAKQQSPSRGTSPAASWDKETEEGKSFFCLKIEEKEDGKGKSRKKKKADSPIKSMDLSDWAFSEEDCAKMEEVEKQQKIGKKAASGCSKELLFVAGSGASGLVLQQPEGVVEKGKAVGRGGGRRGVGGE